MIKPMLTILDIHAEHVSGLVLLMKDPQQRAGSGQRQLLCIITLTLYWPNLKRHLVISLSNEYVLQVALHVLRPQ